MRLEELRISRGPCRAPGLFVPPRSVGTPLSPRSKFSAAAASGAARMGRGAALVESGDRGAIVRPVRRGALPEELVGRQLAMEYVSLGQAHDRLEVGGHQGLGLDDLP